MPSKKPLSMYVLVREDLAPMYRGAQGIHAVAQYSLAHKDSKHYELYHRWKNGRVVILMVKDKNALNLWSMKVYDKKKPFQVYRERDLGGEPTALACVDTGGMFKGLPLAS